MSSNTRSNRRPSMLDVVRGAVLAATLLAGPAAQAAAPAALPPLSRTERLAAFMPGPGPIDLRGDRGEAGLFFSLSTRVEPSAAKLHLELASSTALLAPRSQLVVRLNDVVVAQLTLNPRTPLTAADIDLPVELLRGGGNRLNFTAAQHYANECESPGVAELWSQIDSVRSTLTVTGRPVEAAPHLSELQELLGPGLFGGHRFTLLAAPHPGGIDDASVATGAVLSQALALRLRYRAPEIALAEAEAAGDDPLLRLAPPRTPSGSETEPTDLVLFGTREDLRPVLGPALVEAVTSGFLGIYTLPADRRRLVLVVSGTTPEQVAQAARALTVANVPFVDAPQQTVDQLDTPADSRFVPRNTLAEGARATFASLGFKTSTLRGMSASAGLDLVLPPDLFAPDTADVELALDFAYGAGLRSDSVVNLLVNGQFLQAVALPDAGGGVLRDYRIKVPLAKFRPGQNSIAFEVVMTPLHSGSCTMPQTRNMIFVLHDTSSITMPDGEHMTSQPDLKLFSATGFPYIGSGFDVSLAARDDMTVAAGWTVLARLAQVAGRALPEARVAVGPPGTGHAILVGASADLAPSLLATAPIGLPSPGSQSASAFRYGSATPPPAAAPAWVQWLQGAFGVAARAEGTAPPPGVSSVQGRGALGRNGLLMAFVTPARDNHTATVLTAATPERLWAAAQELVQPTVWYQMDNDVTLWRAGSDAVFTERAGPTFHIGSRSTVLAARYYIGRYPLTWVAGTALSVLAVTLLLRTALVRRRRAAHAGSTEGVL